MRELISPTETSHIPVTIARAELGAGKTSFYQTLKRFNIIPTRSESNNKTALITIAEYRKLTEHYRGKSVEQNGATVKMVTLKELESPGTAIPAMESLMPVIAALVQKIPDAPSDPLAIQRSLTEAHNNGWKLSTGQLAAILGRSKKAIGKYQSFRQYGFYFESYEKGHNRVWLIDKDTQ
jgi:hypothetical protein